MKHPAILFDCDGVLINSETIANDVERKLLARHGLHYGFSEFAARFNGLTDNDFYEQLDGDFRAEGKIGLPDDFKQNLEAEMDARFVTDLKPIDGIEDLLRTHQGDRCVASSSPMKRLIKKLKLTKLHHHFDPHIFSGQQVPNGKPSPDLFCSRPASSASRPRTAS